MAVLFGAQSLLHSLAVFGSALADCAKASSPTNAAHAAAVKVGLITHSPGIFRQTLAVCVRSAPRRETAALANCSPQCEPDRQRTNVPFCSDLSRTKGELDPRRRSPAPPSPFCVLSLLS